MFHFIKLLVVSHDLCREYTVKNPVNLTEVTHFDHPISLVNHQVAEPRKIENCVLLRQELVEATRCSYNDIRPIAQQSELLLS